MKIALIITYYNNPKILQKCLACIVEQKQLPEEVIIADDGSKELIEPILVKFRADLNRCNKNVEITHVWHEDEGYRRAKILNRAIAVTKSDYIVIIDCDCMIEPHFVSDHTTLAKTNKFIQGNRAHLRKEARDFRGFSTLDILARIVCREIYNSDAAVWFPFLDKLRPKTHWNMPLGANFSASKSAFEKINGFDESFTAWGGEDVDIFDRMKRNKIDGQFPVNRCVMLHLDHPELPKDESSWRAKIKEINNKGSKRAPIGLGGTEGRTPIPTRALY